MQVLLDLLGVKLQLCLTSRGCWGCLLATSVHLSKGTAFELPRTAGSSFVLLCWENMNWLELLSLGHKCSLLPPAAGAGGRSLHGLKEGAAVMVSRHGVEWPPQLSSELLIKFLLNPKYIQTFHSMWALFICFFIG